MISDSSEKNQVSLEVLDPRGMLADPKRQGLFAPRPTDLNGKTIAVMALWSDAKNFFATIEEMLREKYPSIKFVHPESMHSPFAKDNTEAVAQQCDAWLDGVKASTTGGKFDAPAALEKRGKPGVAVCTQAVYMLKKLQSDFNGVPTCRIVTVPDTDYSVAKFDPELMKEVARAAFNDILEALTAPLTNEETDVTDFTYDYSPKTFTGNTYAEAYDKFQQYCYDNDMNDGLPVTPPTKEAVDKMLTGISYPPDKVIGLMEPRMGIATVEKIAINAVMAGAKPEYLPVIVAMIETITDKRFNQYHIVNEILPITLISGPIIDEIGINNKNGYLAPGNRPNSTIGRALLMCMINIGWRNMKYYSSPGGPGNPAAYANYVIPENQADNPWPTYAEATGFDPKESTITMCEILAVIKGPSETLFLEPYAQRLNKLRAPFTVEAGTFSHFSNTVNRRNEGARHMIVLHPTMARQLANAGYTRESFIQWLYDSTTIDWDKMTEEERSAFRENVVKGKYRGLTLDDCKPGLYAEAFSDPKHVAVIIAGTGCGASMIFQTSAGSTVSFEPSVDSTVSFEAGMKSLPFMHKVIHGATLTDAGK